jgi:hypothetical protein
MTIAASRSVRLRTRPAKGVGSRSVSGEAFFSLSVLPGIHFRSPGAVRELRLRPLRQPQEIYRVLTHSRPPVAKVSVTEVESPVMGNRARA